MAEPPQPDWFLQDWARLKGKRQADLVNELGLLKNHAFKIWHGRQPYSRRIVNLVAGWLEIEPYELLMPPREAMALRRLRDAAIVIAAEDGASFDMEKPRARK